MNAGKGIEQRLIERLAEDDTDAFDTIFGLFNKQIYTFAYNLLHSGAEAEEVVQNVFMALWKQRGTIKIAVSVDVYLFGMARNIIYDAIRKKINHKAFLQYAVQQEKDYEFITEETILFRELQQLVNELIGRLPERRRQIFTLSRIEGLSYKDISLRLGISENTVDTQIRLALKFLRHHLLCYTLFSLLFLQ